MHSLKELIQVIYAHPMPFGENLQGLTPSLAQYIGQITKFAFQLVHGWRYIPINMMRQGWNQNCKLPFRRCKIHKVRHDRLYDQFLVRFGELPADPHLPIGADERSQVS